MALFPDLASLLDVEVLDLTGLIEVPHPVLFGGSRAKAVLDAD